MKSESYTGYEIAVIGLDCRFPKADNPKQFWHNLKYGVDGITHFTKAELRKYGVSEKILQDSSYIAAKGILEHIEEFDVDYFGYTPNDAKVLDPQVRIFMECVNNALEDAGYNSETYEGQIGLFAGSTVNFNWLLRQLLAKTRYTFNQSYREYLCTSTSYKFGFTGPSVTVESACSTSLAAVHMACQSLLNGDCTIALAGGVNISTPEKRGYHYVEDLIYSPNGKCCSFDADAKGTLVSDGAGIVVLKPLQDALEDKDHIYAVIKGSAWNNDGNRKAGYTAPSIQGQENVIETAMHLADVEPESITMLEAHGTATKIGDSIEVEALKRAYKTKSKQYCAIGSVKSNIGHLSEAAGIAGFIKAVLAIYNRQIPPTLHMNKPNDKILFENSQFYVNDKLVEWKESKYPLRAGVSSFGIGGTNVHVILEEAPDQELRNECKEPELFVLSAKTETVLKKKCSQLKDNLLQNTGNSIQDIAYTLQTGRKELEYRTFFIAKDKEELIQFLGKDLPVQYCEKGDYCSTIYMLKIGTDEEIIKTFHKLYNESILFKKYVHRLLSEVEYLSPEFFNKGIYNLNECKVLQFIIHYITISILWKANLSIQSFVVDDDEIFTAIALQKVVSLEHIIAILLGLENRTMLFNKWYKVKIPIYSIRDNIQITSENCMDYIGSLNKKEREYSITTLKKPTVAIIFGDISKTNIKDDLCNIYSELICFDELLKNDEGGRCIWSLFGKLYCSGIQFKWTELYKQECNYKCTLPTYPFERKRYFLENDPMAYGNEILEYFEKKNKKNTMEYLYQPSWKRTYLLEGETKKKDNESAIVIYDTEEYGPVIRPWCENLFSSYELSLLKKTSKLEGEKYSLEKNEHESYKVILERYVQKNHKLPNKIFIFNTRANNININNNSDWDSCIQYFFYNLIELAQVINTVPTGEKIELFLVMNEVFDLTGEDNINPMKALSIGAFLGVQKEFPDIQCRLADISMFNHNFNTDLWDKIYYDMINNEENISAYRGTYRWSLSYETIKQVPSKYDLELKKDGCYIITGGTGGLGQYLAEWIAKKQAANIILVGKSYFPLRENWQSYIIEHQEDRIANKIRKYLDIEKRGAKIFVYQTDVTDYGSMERLIQEVKNRFGSINGVIHAAGLPGSGLIQTLDRNKANITLKTKILGGINLANLLQNEQIDFLIFFSSIASVAPTIGNADYIAANLFLDAYALWNKKQCIKSILWDVWKNIGMANQIDTIGITPEEGLMILERVIPMRNNQVIVSSVDIEDRIKGAVSRESQPKSVESQEHPAHLYDHKVQEQSNMDIESDVQVQQEVVQIMKAQLGIQSINLEDDFYELGCDSLKAIYICSELKKRFKIALSLQEFFEARNIKKLKEIIQRKLQVQPEKISVVPSKISYPLSWAQKRLYFIHNLVKDSVGYNESLAISIEGQISIEKLEKVFCKLIDRHEILRTSIREVDCEVVQVIERKIPFEIEDIEYINQSIDESIARFIRPFDLSHAPLFRIGIIKIDSNVRVMVADMHHIIADGISVRLLVQDFMKLYQGEKLEQLTIQYKDYCVWQNEFIHTPEFLKQKSYWKKELAGTLPVLNLPLDYSRPPHIDFNGGLVQFLLPQEFVDKLKQYSISKSVTWFTTLLAAYYVVLGRLCKQSDIIIGIPQTGRNKEEFNDIVGMFVNALVLRNRPEASKLFSVFLNEVKQSLLLGMENLDCQVEMILDELNLERDSSQVMLYNTIFNYQTLKNTTHLKKTKVGDLVLTDYDFYPNISKADINIHIYERDEQIQFDCFYRKDLFRESTIEYIMHEYRNLLGQIVEGNECQIGEYELFQKDNRVTKKAEFPDKTNCKYIDYLNDDIHLVYYFEEQARLLKNKIAVVDKDKNLTYGELNKRANYLASYLKKVVNGQGDIVSFLFHNDIEMMISIIACLKAGVCFVPLDPLTPVHRLDYILNETKPRCLVTSNVHICLANELISMQANDLPIVNLDSSFFEQSDHCKNLNLKIDEDRKAFILYTSGSTGKPKGVVQTFRNMKFYMSQYTKVLNITSNDNFILLTTYSHAIGILDIYASLLNGATLYLYNVKMDGNMLRLADYLNTNRITILHSVPSLYRFFMKNLKESETFPYLRMVLLGGEVVTSADYDLFNTYCKDDCLFVNFLGCSELMLIAFYFMYKGEERVMGTIPCGNVIDGIEITILNSQNECAEIYENGELYYETNYLSPGYWEHPELTKEAFVIHPIKKTGTVLKSGDYGRLLPQNILDYKGRNDSQIKVRGYRVDLNEIEIVIDKLDYIKKSVVKAFKNNQDEYVVVAYYTLLREMSLDEIIIDTKKQLPSYLMPSKWIFMEEFPMVGPNKIDRNAFCYNEERNHNDEHIFKPQSEMERLIRDIWLEVLQISNIGEDVGFFDIGGHSLKLMKVQNILENKHHIKVEMSDLFKYPTIRSLADYLNKQSTPDVYMAEGKERGELRRRMLSGQNNE